MKHHRLPLDFDRARLRGDLERVESEAWVAHFNADYYDGEWSGVALRAVDGLAGQIYPDPTASGRYIDTPVLSRSPYFRTVLAAFECPLNSVRLLKLAARSSIREHRDYQLSHTHGEVRIHVPIVTNDDVAFYLDGELLPIREGEAWYLDLELPHRVDNQSDHDRVHLVIDCVENEWLDDLISSGAVAAEASEACLATQPNVAGPNVAGPNRSRAAATPPSRCGVRRSDSRQRSRSSCVRSDSMSRSARSTETVRSPASASSTARSLSTSRACASPVTSCTRLDTSPSPSRPGGRR